MNDPHVVALFYNIEHSASVVYREAEPPRVRGGLTIKATTGHWIPKILTP